MRASDSEEHQAERAGSRPYCQRRPGVAVFAGKPVCQRALRALLGVGETTLQSRRRGDRIYVQKQRNPCPKHPSFGFTMRGETALRWMGVVMYLWYVYHSSAEYMPDNFRAVTRETPFHEVAQSKDEDMKLRAVNSFMKTLHSFSADVDVHTVGPGTFAGERRKLPYASRSELYWEYRAYSDANGKDPASFSTFMRIAKCVLGPASKSGHLSFRKRNEHSQCDDCVRLRNALKKKLKAGESREDQQRAYMRHILSQWLDRQLYWQYRAMSQTWFRQLLLHGDRPALPRKVL